MQFCANFTFGRLLYPVTFTDKGQIWGANKVDLCSTLMCQISSQSVYSVTPSCSKKSQILQLCRLAKKPLTN